MNSEHCPVAHVNIPVDDTLEHSLPDSANLHSNISDLNSFVIVPTDTVDQDDSSDKNVRKSFTPMAEGGRIERSSESDDDDWVPRRCYQFSRRRKRNSRRKKCLREGRSHEYVYPSKDVHKDVISCREKRSGRYATKSCDNLFLHTFRCKSDRSEGNVGRSRKSARSETHYFWNTSTRSEEHIPHLAVHPVRTSQIPKSNREHRFTWSLPSLLLGGKRNASLTGFLGKLSHKGRRRPPSPLPKGNLGRAFAPTPWILVEFSETSDFHEGDSGNESDRSFEAAVAELEERKLESRSSVSNPSNVATTDQHQSYDFPPDSPGQSVDQQQLFIRRLMKSESAPRHCLAPEEERSKTCGLRLSVAPRPLTLGIRGRLAASPVQRDCEGPSGKAPENKGGEGATGEMLPTRNFPRMSSLESIGSCSLDADVTASECSERIGITASQRTLHSISFVDFSPHCDPAESGAPVFFDSTERTKDNQPSPRPSSPSLATSPRPPSYVSLSCSISGYSPLAAYDSELRKGFRSGRDVIQVSDTGSSVPKHTVTLEDQDSSKDLNSKNNSGVPSLEGSRGSVCSPVHRKPCVGEVAMNGSLQGHGDADGRGNESEVCSLRSGHQESMVGTVRVVQYNSQNKSYVRTVTRTFDSASFQKGNVVEERPPSPTYLAPSKSFVQQRVERLYGPGALAQGFFRRTSQRGLTSFTKEEETNERYSERVPARSCVSLPVLRHLRPEFRNQLPVRGTSPKVPPVVTIIPITVEGSEPSPSKEEPSNISSISVEKNSSTPEVKEIVVTAPPDLCPAAPEVVLPLVLNEGSSDVKNGDASVPTIQLPDGEVRDGHYFLRLLKIEIARLTKLVESAEEELNGSEEGRICLPEEAAGWLRSAAGQARLLMRQKMQQFEGLCHKHLSQSPGEAFPTTIEDLAGFWDMVLLQVASVDSMFQEIELRRASGWMESPRKDVISKDGKTDSNSVKPLPGAENEISKKKVILRKTANVTPNSMTSKTSGAAKARDEARRKMMEERRRAMRERQKDATEGSDLGEVEIFVPENK